MEHLQPEPHRPPAPGSRADAAGAARRQGLKTAHLLFLAVEQRPQRIFTVLQTKLFWFVHTGLQFHTVNDPTLN